MSISYIRSVQRGFIEQHKFPENPDKPGCVLGEVPDGCYPMAIDGRVDYVVIKNGMIGCCNFDQKVFQQAQSAMVRQRRKAVLGNWFRLLDGAQMEEILDALEAIDRGDQ